MNVILFVFVTKGKTCTDVKRGSGLCTSLNLDGSLAIQNFECSNVREIYCLLKIPYSGYFLVGQVIPSRVGSRKYYSAKSYDRYPRACSSTPL